MCEWDFSPRIMENVREDIYVKDFDKSTMHMRKNWSEKKNLN